MCMCALCPLRHAEPPVLATTLLLLLAVWWWCCKQPLLYVTRSRSTYHQPNRIQNQKCTKIHSQFITQLARKNVVNLLPFDMKSHTVSQLVGCWSVKAKNKILQNAKKKNKQRRLKQVRLLVSMGER